MRVFSVGLTLAVLGLSVQQASAQQVSVLGSTTVYTAPAGQAAGAGVDFVNAKALELPRTALTSNQQQALAAPAPAVGPGGFVSGAAGDGTMTPMFLGAPAAGSEAMGSQEFGTYGHPFSTARTDLRTAGAGVATNIYYPNRAAGKLFFNIGAGSYLCSASLIKRGIVVTAAHCVANYGASQFYSNWQFVPGYRNGSAPFGVWTAYQAWIKTAYYNGSGAACAVYGIVCPHDLAILTLNSQGGTLPGTSTGYYGYGWNGYGFNGSITQITQIGYPVCLDNGLYQERNDSYGYTDGSLSSNTVIGSLMCGGSSGGPWLVNYGIRPVLTSTTAGTAPDPNIVVGVTSWGYVSSAPKEQGASPFTSSNIVSLVGSACAAAPGSQCL